jgi:hypothetical protein
MKRKRITLNLERAYRTTLSNGRTKRALLRIKKRNEELLGRKEIDRSRLRVVFDGT